jgi:RNA polymerase sigma-70 factor (ECF subfamily)
MSGKERGVAMCHTYVQVGETTRLRQAQLAEIEVIYRSRIAEFRRVARAILGDAESARDAVQDGFVRAIRDRESFRGEGPLEAWVWRCVINAAHNARRKATASRATGSVAGAEIDRDDAVDHELRSIIHGLPERQRLTLFLRYYADLDYATIAAALDVSAGTVAASLHAAHQTIRQELEARA